MSKTERLGIIDRLQTARKSHVISYVTSTRQGLEVPMAMDSIRIVFEHLRLAEPKSWGNIDLFLYSNGGDGTVPWRLATLLREKAKKFSVLVPFRAFSAASLTALGADSVVMHPMGILGPTDPTVTNAFNPPDPTNPGKAFGISVEDVTAYIALVREDAGIQHEEEVVSAFNKLADKVHPLALGNVKRSLSQSRLMAKKLLSLHMDGAKDEHKIMEIVDKLTSKSFYHGHPINRKEAKEEVGLETLEFPSQKVEELMWELYVEYEREMRLEEPFQPALDFLAQFPTLPPNQPGITPVISTKLAYLESEKRTDVLTLRYQLSGLKDPLGVTKVQMLPVQQGWLLE